MANQIKSETIVYDKSGVLTQARIVLTYEQNYPTKYHVQLRQKGELVEHSVMDPFEFEMIKVALWESLRP